VAFVAAFDGGALVYEKEMCIYLSDHIIYHGQREFGFIGDKPTDKRKRSTENLRQMYQFAASFAFL